MGLQLQVKSFKPIAASTTSVASAQTLGGAGNMTLAGTAATFNGTNTAALVSFTSTGNIEGVNFTITGTDINGDAQTETRAGPNNTTVFSNVGYHLEPGQPFAPVSPTQDSLVPTCFSEPLPGGEHTLGPMLTSPGTPLVRC